MTTAPTPAVSAPTPTVSVPSPTPRLQLVETAGTPVPSPTAVSLARRLRLALYDLGVDGIVGSGWVRPCPDGVEFAPLSVRGADRLVQRLEDLAATDGSAIGCADTDDDTGVSDLFEGSLDGPRGVAPVYEQLTLFDPSPWDVSLHDHAGASDGDAVN